MLAEVLFQYDVRMDEYIDNRSKDESVAAHHNFKPNYEL